MSEEKMPKTVVQRKFLLEKKSITLADCKAYVEEFHPKDKKWFYDICMAVNPDTERLVSFLKIKQKFYDRYFKKAEEMSARAKLFADWVFEAEEEEKTDNE